MAALEASSQQPRSAWQQELIIAGMIDVPATPATPASANDPRNPNVSDAKAPYAAGGSESDSTAVSGRDETSVSLRSTSLQALILHSAPCRVRNVGLILRMSHMSTVGVRMRPQGARLRKQLQ